MSTFRFDSGELMNLLSRARSVTSGASIETEFPITNAYDRDSMSPLIWVDGEEDCDVIADLARDTYGEFEGSFTGGIPPGWTSRHEGSGSSAKETSTVASGSGALKLTTTADADVAAISRDYEMARGEVGVARVKLATNNDSGSPTIALRLYDVRARLWYDGDADEWTAAEADACSVVGVVASGVFDGGVFDSGTFDEYLGASSGYQSCEVVFTVPAGQEAKTTIRAYLRATASAGSATRNTYADDFYLQSAWNAAAWVGHNADQGAPLLLQKSTDGSTWSTVATATHRRPTMYALADEMQTARYARQLAEGVNSEQLRTGEALLLQLRDPAHSWGSALPVTWRPSQVREQGPSGRPHVSDISEDIPRDVAMSFELIDDDVRAAFRDELALRSGLGRWPAFVVPDTAVPDAFYGLVSSALTLARGVCSPVETGTITLSETGFPTVGLGL